MRILGIFLYVFISTNTVYNGVHYFVSTITFGTDILYELRSLLDVCLRSTRFFLFLGLFCLVSSVPIDHVSRWSEGHIVLSVSSLGMCELWAHILIPLRPPPGNRVHKCFLRGKLVVFEWDLFVSWIEDLSPF